MNLREFADLLDRILAGSIPAYVSSPEKYQRIEELVLEMGELLCATDNGVEGMGQILAVTLLLDSLLQGQLKNIDFITAPTGRVQ